jgi:hypothetical protein
MHISKSYRPEAWNLTIPRTLSDPLPWSLSLDIPTLVTPFRCWTCIVAHGVFAWDINGSPRHILTRFCVLTVNEIGRPIAAHMQIDSGGWKLLVLQDVTSVMNHGSFPPRASRFLRLTEGSPPFFLLDWFHVVCIEVVNDVQKVSYINYELGEWFWINAWIRVAWYRVNSLILVWAVKSKAAWNAPLPLYI